MKSHLLRLRGDAKEEERQNLHPHGRRPGPVDVWVVPGAHEAQDALLGAQAEAKSAFLGGHGTWGG